LHFLINFGKIFLNLELNEYIISHRKHGKHRNIFYEHELHEWHEFIMSHRKHGKHRNILSRTRMTRMTRILNEFDVDDNPCWIALFRIKVDFFEALLKVYFQDASK